MLLLPLHSALYVDLLFESVFCRIVIGDELYTRVTNASDNSDHSVPCKTECEYKE